MSNTTLNYNKNALDVFRLIATLQVFFGHLITQFHLDTAPVYNAVYFVRGVPILFVLCGFLAAMSLDKYPLKQWLVGRFVRIVPAFWVCIAVNTVIILLVYAVKPTFMELAVYGGTQFLGLNFYTGEWLKGYGAGAPNGVLWTIAAQLQFFILAPLFHKLFKKVSLKWGLGLIGGLTAFSIALYRIGGRFLPDILNKLVNVTVLPYLYFLVGGMLVWAYRDKIIPFLVKTKWGFAASYVLWKIAEIRGMVSLLDAEKYNTVTTLLLCCVVFGFAYSYSWRMPKDYTYGFYLYHMVFMNLCLEVVTTSLTPVWLGILIVLAMMVLTVLASVLSQRFVEIPVAGWLKKGERKHG